ncbi:hypothetical protein [Paraburkholderia sp. J8-2]|uniref:hypothetical protein n=1 Tax=Paraburkholderia sp. J8-2 TaxID=2805440 RepID=UPI002AB702CF|nr:hypothetical protein [Paraburkholderia sp. J8-2]
MQLKITPIVHARYWAAICVASMCGTNLGDIIPHYLGLQTAAGLLLTTVLFALVMLAERFSTTGSEMFYWAAILIVRAAATDIADGLVEHAHLGYLAAGVILLGIFIFAVWQARNGMRSTVPSINGVFWFAMLSAGALGTVVGDAGAHMFGPVIASAPISVALASIALVLVLAARARNIWASATSYWIAVVVVRWWGTNMGDMSTHVLSLAVSGGATLLVLLATLLLWRNPRVDLPLHDRTRGNV